MKNFLNGMIDVKNKKKLIGISFFLLIVILLFPLHHVVAADFLTDPIGAIQDALVGVVGKIVIPILFYISECIFNILLYAVRLGAYFVDVFLDPKLYQLVFSDKVVGPGLATIRDFCDMFYIFFMLIIAFGTILRSQSYSYKNLLPKLIISVLLINFSDVIAKVVIDFGQVFLFGIAGWMGSFSGSNGGSAGLMGMVYNMSAKIGGLENDNVNSLIVVAVCNAFVLLLAFTFVMLAAILLIRLLALAILIMVSPFAFFSMVLPFTKTWQDAWQRQLFKNVIAGPVMLFFVYLSGAMVIALAGYGPAVPLQGNIEWSKWLVDILVQGSLPIAMLLAAPIAAQTVGAYGAGFVKKNLSYGAQGMAAWSGYKGASKVAGWGGRQAGVDTTAVKRSALEGTRDLANKVKGRGWFGSGTRISNAVSGRVTLALLNEKKSDRQSIEKEKANMKEFTKDDIKSQVDAIEALKLRKGAKLTPETQARMTAAMEMFAEKGGNVSENFTQAQQRSALANNLDLKKISTFDPVSAGKLKALQDGSDAEKNTEEYIQNYAETGEWKKFNSDIRKDHFEELQKYVDPKELQKHISSSGSKIREEYTEGADKAMAEAYKDAAKSGNRSKYDELQEKVRKSMKDLEISHALRDDGTGQRISVVNNVNKTIKIGQVSPEGKIAIDDKTIDKAIEQIGGNALKGYSGGSQKMFMENVKDPKQIAGLQLKDVDSGDLKKMVESFKNNPHIADKKKVLESNEVLRNYK